MPRGKGAAYRRSQRSIDKLTEKLSQPPPKNTCPHCGEESSPDLLCHGEGECGFDWDCCGVTEHHNTDGTKVVRATDYRNKK